jgi:DNA polymerase-3 subunit epsilon
VSRAINRALPVMSPAGYLVLDTETTGLGADARVIEIGLVFLDSHGQIEGQFGTLLRGDGSAGNVHARRVHGIEPDHLRSAPKFEEFCPTLSSLLQSRIVLAHNASFDKRIINGELMIAKIEPLPQMGCTMTLGSHLGYGRMKLEVAAQQFGIPTGKSHSALDDALAAAGIFKYYVKKHPKEVVNYLVKLGYRFR